MMRINLCRQIEMEKKSSHYRTVPSFKSKGNLYIFFFELVLSRVYTLQQFFLKMPLIHSLQAKIRERKEAVAAAAASVATADDIGNLGNEDIIMVMDRLGVLVDREWEIQNSATSTSKILGIFEEEEPSLSEIREAFNVFDQNRDGFIDSDELGRVLSALGFISSQGGSGSQASILTMIRNFDDNGDGKIDFREFIRILETRFC